MDIEEIINLEESQLSDEEDQVLPDDLIHLNDTTYEDFSHNDSDSDDDSRLPIFQRQSFKNQRFSCDLNLVPETLTTNSPYIVYPNEFELLGKNLYKWYIKPVNKTSRTKRQNLVRIKARPTNNLTDPLEIFELFYDPTMFQIVLKNTNKKILERQSAYRVNNKTISEVTLTELRALIGLLVFGGALKNTMQSMKSLHNEIDLFGTEYQCCFSTRRHQLLLNMLRFDDSSTRNARRRESKLAPIKEFSDLFFLNCRKNFIPGYYTCIDEQLFGFRGRCPFKMYLPMKPSRYGIKFHLIVCCESGYMFDGFPYIGEGTFQPGERAGLATIKRLIHTIKGSGRNITCDNYYSSVEAVERLLIEDNLTMVATFRSKQNFPLAFIQKENRQEYSSMFLYSPTMMIQSFKVKKRLVLFGSSLH